VGVARVKRIRPFKTSHRFETEQYIALPLFPDNTTQVFSGRGLSQILVVYKGNGAMGSPVGDAGMG